MSLFLSLLPVVATMSILACGIRALYAALIGVGLALLAIMVAFPIPWHVLSAALFYWLPLLTEVLCIIGGGLLLSEILRHSGGQAALANWLQQRANHGVSAVLLIVHGIIPFAESLTGFGIGLTLGIPLLVHFGLKAWKVVIIGLLGLCISPWGSMGPGTLIAAKMSGLSFNDLGLVSAVFSFIPFTITGMIAAYLAAEKQNQCVAIIQGACSGVILTLAVIIMNAIFGTAPAGALAALIVIILYFCRKNTKPIKEQLQPIGRRALWSYALLLGGVLISNCLIQFAQASENWRYFASPALWLFIASFWFAHKRPIKDPLKQAWKAWCQVAPVTLLFILLGILMALSGMAVLVAKSFIGMGSGYLVIAPFIAAMGGFLTGSNSGANAMLVTTQAEIARIMGSNLLWFIGVHNVAACFALIASPAKVEMALYLSSPQALKYRNFIQLALFIIMLVVVAILALINRFLLS